MTLDQLFGLPAGSVHTGTALQRRRDLEVRLLMLKRVLDDVSLMRMCQIELVRGAGTGAVAHLRRLEASVDRQLKIVFAAHGLFDPMTVIDPITRDELRIGVERSEFAVDGSAGAGN